MKTKVRLITQGAIIAALYAVLTYGQNLLIPGSATWAIQVRVSEALCVLAFFTPSAIWGLGVGTFLFNILYAGALPLDWLVGTLATVLATGGMYLCRNLRLYRLPFLGMLFPAVTNGLFIGWELSVYIGGGFWLNGLYVFLGEAIVLFTLGCALYRALERRHIL